MSSRSLVCGYPTAVHVPHLPACAVHSLRRSGLKTKSKKIEEARRGSILGRNCFLTLFPGCLPSGCDSALFRAFHLPSLEKTDLNNPKMCGPLPDIGDAGTGLTSTFPTSRQDTCDPLAPNDTAPSRSPRPTLRLRSSTQWSSCAPWDLGFTDLTHRPDLYEL